MKTSTKDGAGEEAKWDEMNELKDVQKAVKSGEKLVLTAWDENIMSNKEIGSSKPIEYSTLMVAGSKA